MQVSDPHMGPHAGRELDEALFCLFLSCIIFEQNMYTFLLYKRTVRWTVD